MKTTTFDLKSIFSAVGGRIEGALTGHPFICSLGMGFFMNLLIYFLHARAFFDGLANIFGAFGFFLFNWLILVAFYVLALFFKRRIFAMSFMTLFWLAMGVTDCVLMALRNAPLEGIDFYILRTGIGIMTVYMSVFEIILVSFLILCAVALLVLLFVKCPKIRPKYVNTLLILICCLLTLSLVGFAVIGTGEMSHEEFTVENVGFPYFFIKSIFDRGIDQPDDYSEERVRDIIKELALESTDAPQKTPNIIFVQLESFFDVSRMDGVEFSKDPIPNYTALRDSYADGLLGVPSLGSGTANTEFEVLSGLDMGFFGTGEYPYESILGDCCCETVAYDLSEVGYSTHALHNHTATFYDRHEVYSHLGFDSFTALEYMKNLEYNPLGWEKDGILTEYILKALDSTENQDFVFAVSVQGHGKYPDIPLGESDIRVFGIEDEERLNAVEFYVGQLYEMDLFIGELYSAVMERDEDTVLVLYGDHLPALELTEEDISSRELYETDYVILSNFGLEMPDRRLEAYQLFPTLLETLGIRNGLVNKVHAEYSEDGRYSEILELVGYDMLYGDRLAYGDMYPYEPTDMKLGLDDISVTAVKVAEEGTLVEGENFTPFSVIFANGKRLDTEFLSESRLFAEGEALEYGDEITVVQISNDFRKLSETEVFVFSRGFLD